MLGRPPPPPGPILCSNQPPPPCTLSLSSFLFIPSIIIPTSFFCLQFFDPKFSQTLAFQFCEFFSLLILLLLQSDKVPFTSPNPTPISTLFVLSNASPDVEVKENKKGRKRERKRREKSASHSSTRARSWGKQARGLRAGILRYTLPLVTAFKR